MSDDGYKEALRRIRKSAKDKSKILDLGHLNLAEIPQELFGLSHVENCYLHANLLNEIPSDFTKLSNLRTLSFEGNNLKKIPSSIGGFSKLEKLFLNINHIKKIPTSLSKLLRLKELHLDYNQISEIPPSLQKLANLETLDLSHNKLAGLPESLTNLHLLQRLHLSGNSSLGLPTELLESGWSRTNQKGSTPADILEYYFRARNSGRALNEAKLILVGKGAVGKSSLVEKLIYGTFKLGKSKTEGINIEQWPLDIEGDQIRLNVWDFGGQEIMHATHQFFLTERSLYLLVLTGREGQEDTEAEYWLKLIESFGANSPVIIVLNKISEHAFDLNRNALLKKYPNIQGFIRTDCSDNTGIDELRNLIKKETNLLDELRVKFPGEWFSVKDDLASTKKNFLSFEQYRELCNQNDIVIPKHQEMLARYLNQLGIVLNYRDDPRLKDTHILNPRWVTNGIYKILNAKKLEEAHGEIYLEDISGILKEKDYPTFMCRFIFDLMKKFDLCFPFPDEDTHYLIPELLPKDEPQETSEFNPVDCLNFQYNYPVLPEGLLPRFITRTHHLSAIEPRWRSGVILRFEGCRALIKADAAEKRVYISISGENTEDRRRLLAVIRADFEGIHKDIKNLNPQEMIPLPGQPNEIIPYQDLLVMESKGLKEFPKVIAADIETYRVSELLDDVDLPQPKDKDIRPLGLFYSYAHKDESYRIELETHLKILERQGLIQPWKDREIEASEEWRKEISDRLESADIILLLISANFIHSDFCYETEMKRALERQAKGETRVIPVIVKDCNWSKAPFGELQALPTDGKAVDTWDNKDSAWRNVSEGIEKVIHSLKKSLVNKEFSKYPTE